MIWQPCSVSGTRYARDRHRFRRALPRFHPKLCCRYPLGISGILNPFGRATGISLHGTPTSIASEPGETWYLQPLGFLLHTGYSWRWQPFVLEHLPKISAAPRSLSDRGLGSGSGGPGLMSGPPPRPPVLGQLPDTAIPKAGRGSRPRPAYRCLLDPEPPAGGV